MHEDGNIPHETVSLFIVAELIGHQLDRLAAGDVDTVDVAPVMLWGAPGIGKSALIRELCEARGIGFIDIRLAQRDPVDMRGLPVPDGDRVRWLPAAEWPQEDGGAGILLFDELTAADRTLQVAAYELILDRRLGDTYRLPDKWLVCAAGNRSEDMAVSTPFSSALANRFLHLDVAADLDVWCTWAAKNHVDSRLVGFLRFRPGLLLNMAAADLERGWPSPRSWARVSALMRAEGSLSEAATSAAIRGLVGAGAAIELAAYLSAISDAPNLDQLLRGEIDFSVPKRPDVLFALAAGLGQRLWKVEDRERALSHFIAIGLALPADFAMLMLTEAVERAEGSDWAEICRHPSFEIWRRRHGERFAFDDHAAGSNDTKLQAAESAVAEPASPQVIVLGERSTRANSEAMTGRNVGPAASDTGDVKARDQVLLELEDLLAKHIAGGAND